MPSPSGPIEHIVVLMMENRSFDHMLGYLPREGHLKNFEGLTGEEFNHDPNSNKILVSSTATFNLETSVIGVGPPHALPDVNVQLSGTKDGPSATRPATNSGFVRAWIDSLQSYVDAKNADKDESHHLCGVEVRPEDRGRVMECFDPKNLPVLTKLAQEFVLCDHWFCSVPGPTMPNRLYVHLATSRGYAHNDFGKYFDCRTIYDNLTECGYTWTVYWHNLDIAQHFTGLNYCPNRSDDPNFRHFDLFEKDIAAPTRAPYPTGRLAHYSFINPAFITHWDHLRQGFEEVSSQHAPCDVRPGEKLIARVYNALRGNPTVWKKTLLVILYDEHGGFYDHVPPPTGVPNPDGLVSTDPPFDFTRLGPRVPAILISPWLPRKLDSTVYEHSSLLATVKKLLNLKYFLTERDRHANSFEHLFEGAQLRDDHDTPGCFDLEKLSMPTIFPGVKGLPTDDLPMDEVQIQIMEATIPYLPKEEADEVRTLLKEKTITRAEAARLQALAAERFTKHIMTNGGRHPLA